MKASRPVVVQSASVPHSPLSYNESGVSLARYPWPKEVDLTAGCGAAQNLNPSM